MKKILISFVLLSGSLSQAGSSGASLTAAAESTLMFSMLGTFSPTLLTDCSIFQDCHSLKIVLDAKEDAALFVATDGKIKAVKLVLALEVLRDHQTQESSISDMELAQAILAL
jgi:Protein of unknown function (DUF2388).